MFLDLIGTCHSEYQKPVILKPEHLVLHTLQQDCRQNSPHVPGAPRGGHKIESDQKGLHSPVEGVCFHFHISVFKYQRRLSFVPLTRCLCRFTAVHVSHRHGRVLPSLLGAHGSSLFEFFIVSTTCICGPN